MNWIKTSTGTLVNTKNIYFVKIVTVDAPIYSKQVVADIMYPNSEIETVTLDEFTSLIEATRYMGNLLMFLNTTGPASILQQ
jgi:hypothetical protein